MSANQISKINSLFIDHPRLKCYVGPIRQNMEHFANHLLNLIHAHCLNNEVSLSDIFLTSNDGTPRNTSMITYEQFLDGLRKAKIPFPIRLINDIMKYLVS